MFHPHIKSLGLLKANPGIRTDEFHSRIEKNVLQLFPLEVKKTVIPQITEQLISNPSGMLNSQSHVFWALEVTGNAFNLPWSESKVIKNVFQLYRMWLTRVETRPLGIMNASEDTQQMFFQVIDKHFLI